MAMSSSRGREEQQPERGRIIHFKTADWMPGKNYYYYASVGYWPKTKNFTVWNHETIDLILSSKTELLLLAVKKDLSHYVNAQGDPLPVTTRESDTMNFAKFVWQMLTGPSYNMKYEQIVDAWIKDKLDIPTGNH